ARLTPSSVTPTPTPSNNTTVLPSRRAIWVSQRCAHIPESISYQLNSSTLSGSSTRAATENVTGYQRYWVGWDTQASNLKKQRPRISGGVEYNRSWKPTWSGWARYRFRLSAGGFPSRLA